jgi:hypothetical protein
MPDDPITRAEEDLARLAETLGHPDPFLSDLVELADRGISTAVGLFANGMIFLGLLAPSRAMAAEVDAHRRRWAEAARQQGLPEDADPEAYERSLKEFETAATDAVERTGALKEALDDEAAKYATEEGFDYEHAPASLSRRVLRLRTSRYITLQEAQVAAPGQEGLTRLPVVRVSVQHVVGWWLIQTDETGAGSFELWTKPERPGR